MKFTLCALCLVFVYAANVVAAAEADVGHFIPKAFYTLDAEGRQSPLHPVSPHTAHYLRRLRRDTVSVSSSSSVAGEEGGPTYFSQHSSAHRSTSPDKKNRRGTYSGHSVHTDGVIDTKGRVYTKTTKGKL